MSVYNFQIGEKRGKFNFFGKSSRFPVMVVELHHQAKFRLIWSGRLSDLGVEEHEEEKQCKNGIFKSLVHF